MSHYRPSNKKPTYIPLTRFVRLPLKRGLLPEKAQKQLEAKKAKYVATLLCPNCGADSLMVYRTVSGENYVVCENANCEYFGIVR
jgi:hypothetical protein